MDSPLSNVTTVHGWSTPERYMLNDARSSVAGFYRRCAHARSSGFEAVEAANVSFSSGRRGKRSISLLVSLVFSRPCLDWCLRLCLVLGSACSPQQYASLPLLQLLSAVLCVQSFYSELCVWICASELGISVTAPEQSQRPGDEGDAPASDVPGRLHVLRMSMFWRCASHAEAPGSATCL